VGYSAPQEALCDPFAALSCSAWPRVRGQRRACAFLPPDSVHPLVVHAQPSRRQAPIDQAPSPAHDGDVPTPGMLCRSLRGSSRSTTRAGRALGGAVGSVCQTAGRALAETPDRSCRTNKRLYSGVRFRLRSFPSGKLPSNMRLSSSMQFRQQSVYETAVILQ